MYADDLCIASSTPNAIRMALQELSEWCKSVGMVVNVQKTHAMRFRKTGRLNFDMRERRLVLLIVLNI